MSDIDTFLSTWAAAEQDGDAAVLDGLLTEDFVGVGPLGFALPKPAWLARFRDGLHYDTFGLEEVSARQHGDSALVTARQNQTGTHGGNKLPFEAVRVTLGLIQERGEWRLGGAHMSFIAGTPGAPPLPGPPSGRDA